MVIIQYLGQNVKDYFKNFFYAAKIPLPLFCPYCGHLKLIRWGYYWRQSFSTEKTIPIQRVRCKSCLRTSSLIPTFLAPYKRASTPLIQHLVTSYVYTHKSLSQIWKDCPQAPTELSTLYRWMKILTHNAGHYQPLIIAHILHLNPHSAVGEKVALTTHKNHRKAKLLAFLTAAEYCFHESKTLFPELPFTPDRLLEFISRFLWLQAQGYLLSNIRRGGKV